MKSTDQPTLAFDAGAKASPAKDQGELEDPQSQGTSEVREASQIAGKNWLSSGVLAVFDQGLVSLTSFLTMILLARLCSTTEVGLYALAWSLLNIARVIQERAISAPYVVFVHQPGRDSDNFTASSLLHQAGFGALSFLVFMIVAGVFSFYGNVSGLGASLIFVAISLPFVLLRDHLRIISGAHLRYGIAAGLNGSALVLQMLLIVLLHRQNWLNASTAFACMGIASLVPATIWLTQQPVKIRLDGAKVKEDLKVTFAFSKWLVAARIFPTASAALMPWIVFGFLGKSGAAVLATCLTLSNISMLVVLGANNFLQLRTVLGFHGGGAARMLRVMVLSIGVYGIVLVPFVIALWFWGGALLAFSFGPQYAGYGDVITLLALHTLVIAWSTVFGNGMSALSRPRGLFLGEFGYAIVAVLAAYWLTSQYGLVGTGLALCLAATVSAIISGGCFLVSLRSSNGTHIKSTLGDGAAKNETVASIEGMV